MLTRVFYVDATAGGQQVSQMENVSCKYKVVSAEVMMSSVAACEVIVYVETYLVFSLLLRNFFFFIGTIHICRK